MDSCIHGDVREVLPTLADGCAQMCVTSPPYWGLRDYGTATWEGGDAGCSHKPDGANKVFGNPEFNANRPSRELTETPGYRRTCAKCGAKRIDSQLGLEATPDEYVATMVDVFREVRRVLADDGTLWLNLGDSYNAGHGGSTTAGNYTPKVSRHRDAVPQERPELPNAPTGWSTRDVTPRRIIAGLKPKDLVGIPWRVAFALQADGWYLRQDIIWAKSNPMPESVTDRCTKAHEYVFLLSKAPRYYFDADAIREPHVDPLRGAYGERIGTDDTDRAKPGVRTGTFKIDRGGAQRAYNPAGRNRRSVWTIASEPYPDAHFATFPCALVEPCILAGSRTGDTVLDPFMGSGTVAQVAQDLNRRWLGVELSAEYIALQRRRTAQLGLDLAEAK